MKNTLDKLLQEKSIDIALRENTKVKLKEIIDKHRKNKHLQEHRDEIKSNPIYKILQSTKLIEIYGSVGSVQYGVFYPTKTALAYFPRITKKARKQ